MNDFLNDSEGQRIISRKLIEDQMRVHLNLMKSSKNAKIRGWFSCLIAAPVVAFLVWFTWVSLERDSWIWALMSSAMGSVLIVATAVVFLERIRESNELKAKGMYLRKEIEKWV